MLKFQPRFFIQTFVSLFVLAFGAWAFYEYYQAQKEKEKEEELALFLPHTELNQLKAFQIEQANQKLSAVKTDKEWLLEEPVKDLLDGAELSRWLDTLKKQKVQKISTANIDWKSYYLDSAPSVHLDLEEGKKIIFSVSKKSSFDGRYFIKKGEELFIGDSSFFSEVNEKNLENFRSKKILPDLTHASQIQFKGKSHFQLNWKDYKWSLKGSKPTELPLDSSRLDGFWTDIRSLKALSIKAVINSKSLKKYRLNKPQLTLTLVYGDKEYVLKLSSVKEEKAFVVISHRDYIFEISKEQADKLLLPKKEIYDHNFPFRYKTALATQVERHAGKDSFSLKKEGENWKSAEKANSENQKDKKREEVDSKNQKSEKGKEVNSEKLEDLLDQVKELRGERYKKAIDKKPLRFFTVKEAKGQLIFELKEISQFKDISWVQTNLWSEQIALSKSDLDKIFNQDIFKVKENKPTPVKSK